MATLAVPRTRGFTVEQQGKMALFCLKGPLTCESDAEPLLLELRAFFEEDWTLFTIDFSEATQVTAEGFRQLHALRDNLRKVPGGTVWVRGMNTGLREDLAKSNLDAGFAFDNN